MNNRMAHSVRRSVRLSGSERLLAGLLLAIMFCVCLSIEISQRVIGLLTGQSDPGRAGVFTEAKSAAHAAVGYVFMV